MLTLPIKKKWFDMIASGEKKEEYREITEYYLTRFETVGLIFQFMPTDEIHQIMLRNGYSKNSPTMKVNVRLTIGEGKPEWGAEPNKTYYVLHIKGVELIKDGEQN